MFTIGLPVGALMALRKGWEAFLQGARQALGSLMICSEAGLTLDVVRPAPGYPSKVAGQAETPQHNSPTLEMLTPALLLPSVLCVSTTS